MTTAPGAHLIPPPRPATGALALDTYALTKRFGSFTAMDQVTMHVAAGTVHALLGENGAGKSTLVKCVAGFQQAEDGSVADRWPRAGHHQPRPSRGHWASAWSTSTSRWRPA